MKKDERIQTTHNRIAAGGFTIWYVLTLISLTWRAVTFRQHPREYWDIAAIFWITNLFVLIAYATKGIFDHGFGRRSLTIGTAIAAISGLFTVYFTTGQMDSLVDVYVCLIGSLAGMGLVIGIAHLLHWRRKRKEGLEDEE